MFRQKFRVLMIMERRFSVTNEENGYQAAVKLLNSLVSNAKDQKNFASRQYDDSSKQYTKKCVERCGINLKSLESTLSIIHVSGTKGKGSTCAYCECMLRNFGYKTGFFSSPHLVSVRERIQINGKPLSKAQFVTYFWDIYNKLENTQEEKNDMPTYFIFLTVMALKVFLIEKVDVAILEVGIGGEYDCTNIFHTSVVVGITSLGLDHVTLLGNTIEQIAWQKSGIMKPNSIAIISAHQLPESLKILSDRAASKNCRLFEAPPLDKYTWLKNGPKISINGPQQHLNASLALQLVNCWRNPQMYKDLPQSASQPHFIQQAPVFPISEEMARGLESCVWPGRTQILDYSARVRYYLDGAHTIDSMKSCVFWYQTAIFEEIDKFNSNIRKVVIFYVTGDRSYSDLIKIVMPCNFDFVLLCPTIISTSNNPTYLDVASVDEERVKNSCQMIYQEWLNLNKYSSYDNIVKFNSILESLTFISALESKTDFHFHILVTGSLYLVGGVLTLLGPELTHS